MSTRWKEATRRDVQIPGNTIGSEFRPRVRRGLKAVLPEGVAVVSSQERYTRAEERGNRVDSPRNVRVTRADRSFRRDFYRVRLQSVRSI